ncbi:MAG: hypothetical protein Fur0043_02460 [Anaerolineales bacterium]
MDDKPLSISDQTTRRVEDLFLTFFERRGYHVIPGSSLVDDSLPMTFVMSAGLVQVERGIGKPAETDGNLVLVQNCFRHFDLERIGRSDVHLSLFRMLGAFTFGAIRREERIAETWELLTRHYGLAPRDLWATYFQGDRLAGQSLPPDTETYQTWRKLGLPAERLVGLGLGQNYWRQGGNFLGGEHHRKCGPISEIWLDRGNTGHCNEPCQPGCSCGRFVEFVNILFIESQEREAIICLDSPFTETVIGVERLAMALEGVPSIFDCSEIKPLLEMIRAEERDPVCSGTERPVYERQIADHLRALLFLTADGAPPPGKGGRAYLMRRLVRELLTAQRLLGLDGEKCLPRLISSTARLCAPIHPGIPAIQDAVCQNIFDEARRFEHTLQKGFQELEQLQNRQKLPCSKEDLLVAGKGLGIPPALLMLQVEKYLTNKEELASRALSDVVKTS